MASRSQAQARTSRLEVRRLTPEEVFGLGILSFGVAAFANLVLSNGVPVLTVVTGWLGPLVGAACIGSGILLLYDDRLPNWRLPAMIGVMLALLAQMAGTFIWQQPGVDWAFALDGSHGGAIGRAFGNMLMERVGRPAAGMIVWVTSLLGLYLFVRHSPLMSVPIWIMARLMHVLRIGEVPAAPIDPTTASAASDPPVQEAEESGQEEMDPAPVRAAAPRGPAAGTGPATATSQAGLPVDRKRGDSGREQAERILEDQHTATVAEADAGRQRILPPLDLLSRALNPELEVAVQQYANRIENLYSDYGQPVEVTSIDSGPAVTRFGVKPLQVRRGGGYRPVRVKDVLALREDMKMGLEAENLRFQAPVPGRNFIGIEVPNQQRLVVALRDVLESPSFEGGAQGLHIAMGQDTSGAEVVTDLVAAPHMLVCGATGTGKSTFMNALLVSLLMQHGPDTLNLMLVDPKQIELTQFSGLPHLIGKVATSPAEVPTMLLWLIMEMESRYAEFRRVAARDIAAYNRLAKERRSVGALPYIVLVIDELADLMLIGDDTIEQRICRLAQKSRATGIHIVLATQRPSVDVVTGSIKANFPARVAFAVSSSTDSRVVLDGPGAETLMGKGDMIFQNQGRSRQQRVQGSWVDEDDLKKVVAHWRDQAHDFAPATRVEPWRGLFGREGH